MQIGICEDKQKDAKQLATLLGQYTLNHQLEISLQQFASGDDLLKNYQAGFYQILFLDILMDGTNGMNVAKKIRQIDTDVAIIFTTVSEEFAVDSYKVDASFYLVKPLDYEGLSTALSRCQNLLQQYAKIISVTEGRILKNIRLRDIIYVESQRNDCILHTSNDNVRTRIKLSELELALNGWPFLRCHHSFIVNLHWLTDMLDNNFVVRSGNLIPISRAHSTAAHQAFHDFLTTTARKNSC